MASHHGQELVLHTPLPAHPRSILTCACRTPVVGLKKYLMTECMRGSGDRASGEYRLLPGLLAATQNSSGGAEPYAGFEWALVLNSWISILILLEPLLSWMIMNESFNLYQLQCALP